MNAPDPAASAPRLRVAHVDAETGFSGGEVQVFLLVEGLLARGHRCILVVPPGSRSAERARATPGLELALVPMRNDLDAPAVLRIARALRRTGADLVHGHTGRATWLAALAARAAGVPAVSTRRMDREVKRGPRNRWLYRSLLARVAAISPAVEGCLRAGGVPAERTVRIWSAVDPARLVARRPRDEVRAELGVAGGAPLVLAAGALHARKGFDVLLAAFARAAGGGDAELRIAGDGPERGALERAGRAHGLDPARVLLGRREDVPDLLSAADVFAMPSRREGLGVAALEAMGHGRAVVASQVGGLGEAVVDGVTGLLVPPGEVAPLADALARLLADPALRARLGAAGPPRIDATFRPEAMVAAYEALYLDVLGGARGGGAEVPGGAAEHDPRLPAGNPAGEVAGGGGK